MTSNTFKDCEQKGKSIGEIEGCTVWPISFENLKLENKNRIYKYAVYDNFFNGKNEIAALLESDGDFWYKVGTVKRTGEVIGCKKVKCDIAAKEDEVSEIVADVIYGNEIDKVLLAARTISIDSLLDGFNYGL